MVNDTEVNDTENIRVEQRPVSRRVVLLAFGAVSVLLLLIGGRVYFARLPKRLNTVEQQLVGSWIVYRPIAGSSQQDQYILTLNSDRSSLAVGYHAATNQWIQVFTGDAWSATSESLRFKDRSVKVLTIPIPLNEDVTIADVTRDGFTWDTGKSTETLRRATAEELNAMALPE